jgi:hypothetical protein
MSATCPSIDRRVSGDSEACAVWLWQHGAVEEVFRPAFGRGLSVVVAVLGVAVVAFVAATSGVTDAVLTLPWVLLFVASCWAIYWRPCVVVSNGGVRLVNVTRTIDVPWPSITDVETRYALTLVTAYGRFAAWAAPAPSAGTALRTAMRSRPPAGEDEVVRTVTKGEMAGTPSGDAATMVRRRWDRLRADGFLDDPRLEFEAPPIRWHWKIGLLLAGLAALSLGSLLAS